MVSVLNIIPEVFGSRTCMLVLLYISRNFEILAVSGPAGAFPEIFIMKIYKLFYEYGEELKNIAAEIWLK